MLSLLRYSQKPKKYFRKIFALQSKTSYVMTVALNEPKTLFKSQLILYDGSWYNEILKSPEAKVWALLEPLSIDFRYWFTNSQHTLIGSIDGYKQKFATPKIVAVMQNRS